MNRVYIGIGSNLAEPVAQVRRGIAELRALGVIAAVSSIYRTEPWGKKDQPTFVNAVVALDTEYDPRALMHALKNLEVQLGRTPGKRWGPRSIDFDILDYVGVPVTTKELVIPHPHLRDRAFVLVPLAEIAPQYAPMRDALPQSELAGVVPLGDVV
jgi:2-amino-4-hydroxy-6-hydroxymethyldihydropteridine diphosphokinase